MTPLLQAARLHAPLAILGILIAGGQQCEGEEQDELCSAAHTDMILLQTGFQMPAKGRGLGLAMAQPTGWEEPLRPLRKETELSIPSVTAGLPPVPRERQHQWGNETAGLAQQATKRLASAGAGSLGSQLGRNGPVPRMLFIGSCIITGFMLLLLTGGADCLYWWLSVSKAQRASGILMNRKEEMPSATIAVILLYGIMQDICTTMHVPSLPQMAEDLDCSPQLMSFTLQVSWIVKGIACMFAGPMSDRLGRRSILLTCCLLLFVSTLSCACAPSYAWFVLARVLQGVAGSGEAVLGAVVRDYYDDPAKCLEVLEWLSMALLIAPVLAPTLGGLVAYWVGWRCPFLFVAIGALATTVLGYRNLPESTSAKGHSGGMLRDLEDILLDVHLLMLLLCGSLLLAVWFTLDATLPFVLEREYGLSSNATPFLIGFIGLATVASAFPDTSGSLGALKVSRGLFATAFVPVMFLLGILLSLHPSLRWFLGATFTMQLWAVPAIVTVNGLFMQKLEDIAGTASSSWTCGTHLLGSMLSMGGTALVITGQGDGAQGLLGFGAMAVATAAMVFFAGFGLLTPGWASIDAKNGTSVEVVKETLAQMSIKPTAKS